MDDATQDWIASLDPKVNGTEFAMSRRRQHVAHEIGHTLGLAHNYISHAYGRASVMDYPGPLVTFEPNGTLDVSNAWTVPVRAPTTRSPSATPTRSIECSPAESAPVLPRDGAIGDRGGARFLTDRDASAGVIPEATRWLNGDDAVKELERQSAVRDVLLSKFNES